MTDLFEPSLAEQIACVEREIAMRLRVYPRYVEAHKMPQEKADREIAIMRAVSQTLRKTVAVVPLFDAAAAVVTTADHLGHQGFRANLAEAVTVLNNAGLHTIADEVVKISRTK